MEQIEANVIYDLESAGNLLGCGRQTLIKLVNQNKLKAKRLGQGSSYRFLGKNLLKFMEEPN